MSQTTTWSKFVQELRSDSGWRVVLAAAVGYGLGLTVLPFVTLGAFVPSLEKAFGWSRAQVQGSIICITAATLIGGWAVGWLTDRYGVRTVGALSHIGLGSGLFLLSQASGDIYWWYATWFYMSFVALGTTPISWTRGISGWFDAGRGVALALALAASGVVSFIATPSISVLIGKYDWRAGYLAMAAIVLLVAVPVTWFVFPKKSTRPSLVGKGTTAAVVPGAEIGEALRDYRFWLLFVSTFAIGFALGGFVPNFVPLLVGNGLTLPVAASFVGLYAMAAIFARLIAGFAMDRVWAPAVACLFMPFAAVGCLILATGTTNLSLIGFASICFALASGAEFDVVPFLSAKYFGVRNYSKVYSVQWIGFTVAAGVAPAVFGRVYDVTKSYQSILYVAAVLFVLAGVILLGMGRYPVFAGQDRDSEPALKPAEAGA